jgi:hypothetical protein
VTVAARFSTLDMAGASLKSSMEANKNRECYRTLGRQRFSSARGGSRLRLVVWTAILAALLYITYKVTPPYFANYEFEDDLRQEGMFSMGKYTDDQVRERVFKEMQARGVDATKDDSHIQQNDSRGLKILVDYTVTVDMLVYDLKLHFTPSTNSQSLVQ